MVSNDVPNHLHFGPSLSVTVFNPLKQTSKPRRVPEQPEAVVGDGADGEALRELRKVQLLSGRRCHGAHQLAVLPLHRHLHARAQQVRRPLQR